MKSMKLMLLLTLLIAGLAACKKDDVAPSIVGRWEGKWGFGNEAPNYDETWEIESNGELTVYDDDGDLYAIGSWELDGNIFEAEYHSIGNNDYSFTGLYSDQLDEITGTWGSTPSSTDGGIFEMYK